MIMWCILYTFVHLHKHTHEILLLKAWAVIWCRSTRSYMKWVDWLQREDVGLLEIERHDKWGQHGWVAKWSNTMIVGYWDQHIESSFVLMSYYLNVENCLEIGRQYASCESWIVFLLLLATMHLWNILESLICDMCRWLWIC